MTFGEFLSQLLGWLGEFIAWVFNWVPRRVVIEYTTQGVHYPLGDKPTVVMPGTFWYIPNRGHVAQHHVNQFVLEVEPMALETQDGVAIAMGMTITCFVSDVYKYEVNNYSPDSNIVERARSGLREIVMEHTWADLCKPAGEGTRFEGKLSSRMTKTLSDFGVEVVRCGLTDQVRLGRGAHRLFGVSSHLDLNHL